ncbi:protein of unknown function [Rhodovastum atsumiense]|nr:phasin family protein [Rhodovastum atsumiense]CAH2600024.1 protein of unknown function [Rhodovastum atsumiense]
MAQTHASRRGQDASDRPGTEEQAPWLRTVTTDEERAMQDAAQKTETQAAQSADSIAQASQAAAGRVRQVGEDGSEATAASLRAMAGLQEPFAQAGLEQGRRFAEATIRMTEAYREASERSAGDVQAMVASFASLSRGAQHWQNTWFELMQNAFGRAQRRHHDLLGCRSMVALAEVQRDMYLEAVEDMLGANTRLLRLAGQIVEEAARPLQERGHPIRG